MIKMISHTARKRKSHTTWYWNYGLSTNIGTFYKKCWIEILRSNMTNTSCFYLFSSTHGELLSQVTANAPSATRDKHHISGQISPPAR